MKRTSLLLLTAACTFALPVVAADSYMKVYSWDPGCEHTVETNNFNLAPGAVVEIQVDLSACPAERLGNLLFYGYAPRNSGADALTRRHNVRLRVVTPAGTEVVADDGHVFTQVPQAGQVTLIAENLNSRRGLTIRLVSRSGI